MLGSRLRQVLSLSLFTLFTISAFAQTVTRVQTGNEPAWIAVDPLRNLSFVANDTDPGSMTVIRNASALTTVPVGPHPLAVAVNVATHRIYISSNDFTSGTASVWVLDENNYQVVTVIPISNTAALGVQGIAVDPITNRIYVTDGDNNTVVMIDGSSNQIISTHPYGFRSPAGLAVNIATHRVFVALNGSAVSVLDGATLAEVASVPVPFFAYQVAVNPVTNRAYVTSSNGSDAQGTLSIIDGKTNTLIRSVATGNYPFGVDVNVLTNRVYVANNTDSSLSVYDGNGNLRQTVVLGGPGANFVGVNPVTNRVYVSDFSDSDVFVVRF